MRHARLSPSLSAPATEKMSTCGSRSNGRTVRYLVKRILLYIPVIILALAIVAIACVVTRTMSYVMRGILPVLC